MGRFHVIFLNCASNFVQFSTYTLRSLCIFFYYLLCSSCDVSEYSGFDMDVALGLPEQPLIVPFGKYNRERQKRKTIPTHSQFLSLSVRSRISGGLSLSVCVFV